MDNMTFKIKIRKESLRGVEPRQFIARHDPFFGNEGYRILTHLDGSYTKYEGFLVYFREVLPFEPEELNEWL